MLQIKTPEHVLKVCLRVQTAAILGTAYYLAIPTFSTTTHPV